MDILTVLILLTVLFFSWIIIGVIAIGCEIRWGFPFEILPSPKEYNNDIERRVRKSIVVKSIRNNIISDIISGPVMLLIMIVGFLLACISAALRYIFVLPARKLEDFFIVHELSPTLVSLTIIAVILILIWARVL